MFRQSKLIGAALATLATSALCVSAQVLTFEQAKQRADAGDAYAQAVVALHYQLGWNTEKNPELAVKYALASAKAGSPLGQFRLGALLRAGEGVPKDEEKGLALQAAAFDGLEQMTGDPYALTSLGVMIFQGKAVWQNVPQEKRRQQAAQLYKRAADAGFAPAQFNYAMCAEAGHGVVKDAQVREAYLQEAAALAYPLALQVLTETDSSIADRRVPPFDPELSILSAQTRIWQDRQNPKDVEAWISLGAPEPQNHLSLEIRCDYSGWPVAMNNSAEYAYQNHKTVTQYYASEAGNCVEVKCVTPLTEPRLIEYPVSFVLRLRNESTEPVYIQRIDLDVSEWRPINKIWLDVATFFPDLLALHNYGWGAEEPWRAEISINGGDDSETETVALDHEQGATTFFVPTQIFRKPSVLEHIRDPHYTPGQIFVSLPSGHFGPRGSSMLGIHESKYITSASSSEALGNNHIKIPADITLPAYRHGYKIDYRIGRRIEPGAFEDFGVSVDSSRSGEFTIRAGIRSSAGNVIFQKPIVVSYECIRPVPGLPIDAAFVDPGNGGGYGFESYQRALVGQDESSSISEGVTRIDSLLGNGLSTSVYSANFDDDAAYKAAAEIAKVEEYSIYAQLQSSFKGEAMGAISVRSAYAERPIFEVEWPIPNGARGISEKLKISAVAHPSLTWIAWLVDADSSSALYVAFPRIADVAILIPSGADTSISGIGISKHTGELVVFGAGESRSIYDLQSALVRSALSAFLARDMGITSEDSESALSPRLLCVQGKITEQDADRALAHAVRFSIQASDEPSPELIWPEPNIFAFKTDGKWFACDIVNARVKIAPRSDVEKFEKALTLKEQKIRGTRDRQFSTTAQKEISLPVSSARQVTLMVDQSESDQATLLSSDMYPDGRRMNAVDGQWRWLHVPYDNNGVLGGGTAAPRRRLSRRASFAPQLAVSPSGQFALLSCALGKRFYIADLQNNVLAATAHIDAERSSAVTLSTPEGYFASSDIGNLILTSRNRLLSASQFESKLNRPDIIFERLGADESLIKEAKRLRERFVRRSDFKSFDGATLIDIPVVTVKSEVPEETSKKSLSLNFEASNSTGPLKELRVFNNGALVKTLELKGKEGQPSRETAGEVEIDLASGENRLQLMAVSEEGFTSSFAEKRVNCTSEPDSRRCFIAAVGVSEYNDPRFNLKFAAKDAEDISKALAEKARHRGYLPEVLVVKNAEVDSGLVDKLREFLSQAGTDDEVVLFFAGHGLLDKDLEYHFARHDTDFDATENMGITFEALESLVDGIKPLKRTVLFDTCHSGEVEEEDKPQLLAMVGSGDLSPAADADTGVQVRGVATRGMKVTGAEPKLRHTDFVELEGLFPDSRRAKGANILTSSSGSEFSIESDAWQNGLFTYAFLYALQDEKTDTNGDQSISFNEAAAAVQNTVQSLSGGHQRPITRGVNREAEVTLASFGPPVAPVPTKQASEKKSSWWPF